MNKFHQKTSLCEKSVQKVARENIKHKKMRGPATRKANTKVVTKSWKDGLDERVIKKVESLKIPEIHKRIEVKSPTEVVIHNDTNWRAGKKAS